MFGGDEMNDLKSVNVEKCLSMINEFYDAVAVDESNHDLLFKKQEAGKALDHLGTFFKAGVEEDDDSGCGSCNNSAQSTCGTDCVTGTISKLWSTKPGASTNE